MSAAVSRPRHLTPGLCVPTHADYRQSRSNLSQPEAGSSAGNWSGEWRRSPPYQVGCPFRDHDDRCVDVAAGQIRYDRRIDDPETCNSPDAELGVHDRRFVTVGTHLAGTCRVMNGDPGRADMRIEVGVGIAISLRRELLADERGKR